MSAHSLPSVAHWATPESDDEVLVSAVGTGIVGVEVSDTATVTAVGLAGAVQGTFGQSQVARVTLMSACPMSRTISSRWVLLRRALAGWATSPNLDPRPSC